MTLPMPSNTTCEIYRNANSPPAAPDVALQRVYLKSDWEMGQEHGDRPNSQSLTWTHIMLIDDKVDVRDGYSGSEASGPTTLDHVWIPDRNGTRFDVTFVQLMNRGLASSHKKVFLDRYIPPWPTNNL